jgi:hypothetical protein
VQVVLLPERVTVEDGIGAEVAVGPAQGHPLVLTLGITRIMQQQSLDVSIWGSADRTLWRQLATFPQKFYCGTYLLLLDLSEHRHVRYLRAQWRMGRWGEGESETQSGFYVFAETCHAQTAGAA